MDVFVAIGELVTERAGTPFNFFRPPSTNIVDGVEGLFRSLVYRKSCSETGILHGLLSFPSLLTRELPRSPAQILRTVARTPWLRQCASPPRWTVTLDRGRYPLHHSPIHRRCPPRLIQARPSVSRSLWSCRCQRGPERRRGPSHPAPPAALSAIASC